MLRGRRPCLPRDMENPTVYEIHPPEVLILDRVKNDPLMSARLDRMLPHVNSSSIQVVDYAGLAEAVSRLSLGGGRTGQYHSDEDPVIVFNTFRFDADDEVKELAEKHPTLRGHRLLGTAPWGYRDHLTLRETQNCVCQSAWEFHCAFGCLHACQYCHVYPLFNIMMNMEELAERMRAFGETIPEQQLYKFDNATDQITLEPEYGASEIMVEMFADWPGRFILLYTKSDNVDHLLDLDHNGHTLISWSLNSDAVTDTIERNTPSLDRRIYAMERCQEAGYGVRARLSPMCPVEGWRDAYTGLAERLLARTTPEVISVDVVGWMNADQMVDALDTSLFEAPYRDELARMAVEGERTVGKHLFRHELRAPLLRHVIEAVRRVRPEQPISLCNETPAMWQELSDVLEMTPDHYVCCCGPDSVPGHSLLARS